MVVETQQLSKEAKQDVALEKNVSLSKLLNQYMDETKEEETNVTKFTSFKRFITPFMIVFMISMGSLNFGWVVSQLSPFKNSFLNCPHEDYSYNNPCWSVPSSFVWSMIVSIAYVGAAIVGFLGGSFADITGRKIALILTNILLYLPGYLIMILVPHYSAMIVGRFLIGAGVGMTTSVASTLVGELSPPKYRGLFGFVMQGMVVSGIFFVYVLALIFENMHRGFFYYNFPIILVTIIHTICLIFFVPFSPVWLIYKRKNYKRAISILKSLNRSNEIKSVLENSLAKVEETNTSSLQQAKIILKSPKMYKAVLITFALMVGRQFSGMNSFAFYLNDVLAESGIENASLGGLIFSVANIVGLLVGMPFIDLLGRRVFLISGTLLMIISLCFYSALQYFGTTGAFDKGFLSIANLVVLCIFPFFYQNSLGAVPFFIVGELCDDAYRSFVSAFGIAMTWAAAVVVGMITPIFMQYFGPWAWTPWTVCMIALIIFIVFVIPETKAPRSKKKSNKVIPINKSETEDEETNEKATNEKENVTLQELENIKDDSVLSSTISTLTPVTSGTSLFNSDIQDDPLSEGSSRNNSFSNEVDASIV